MKIVFSRKGFDSGYGGCPSPIFPDGEMVSLPIPGGRAPWRYSQIEGPTGALAGVVHSLSKGAMRGSEMVHLDPDLDSGSVPRKAGWKPSLGQAGAAQSHLEGQGVGPGDLLLFFGWFRPVVRNGEWAYAKQTPAVHALFGYLQIGHSLRLGAGPDYQAIEEQYPWLHDHPHLHGERSVNNTIHVASDELILPDGPTGLPGAGAFSAFSPDLQLTAPGVTAKSRWQLPDWMGPDEAGRGRLSYHADAARWSAGAPGQVQLQTVAKGQEFVMDVGARPDALAWIKARCSHPLRGAIAAPNATLSRRPRPGR